jgi:methyltransferase
VVTRWLFALLVAAVGGQRLLEMRRSQHNERLIRAAGGEEHAPWQLQLMKGLHSAWLLGMLVEVFGRTRPFRPATASLGLALLCAGQALRYAAIRTLGWRWTVRVMTLPGIPPVRRGIYRRLRHPNYLGVALEILGLPLVHSAYITALIFSLANTALLYFRIRTEEAALHQAENS